MMVVGRNLLRSYDRLLKSMAGSKKMSSVGRTTYKSIQDTVNKQSSVYIRTLEANKQLETDYLKVLNIVEQGGGKKGVERHLKQGKLLARDRISRLLDTTEDFLELSSVAGMGMKYGDVPSAGVIAGIGRVHGSHVMVIANDGTVKGGTVFPVTLKKQLRAQQIAQELYIPCVYIVDSGGAFLPLQSEIFIDGGRSFYNEAIMSSMGIPQVAVVCGMCTAGGAYIPTMADEAIMVHKTGSIFLAGPPLVKAALGEIISAEELGGATMHSTVSGCVDHFAKDEPEAYEICRDVILSLNLSSVNFPTSYAEPLYNTLELSGIVTADNPNPHQVIARLVDGSAFQEFKSLFGNALVTGFAKLAGYPLGIVANSSATIDSDSSVKASHFIQLCCQRSLPIVFLMNQSDQQRSPESGDLLKCHARLMAAVSCADVPKVTVITGSFHGIDGYAMGSKALGSNFVFHWPSAKFGIHSPDLMKEQLSDSYTESEQDRALSTYNSTSSALYAATRVWTDGIILPQSTRQVLKQVMKIFHFTKSSRKMADLSSESKQVNYRM